MNTAEIRNDSLESKSTRFGFGFERKSSTNPSTQQARAFFLKLLPQLRSDVTPTLFESGYSHFVDFLKMHRDEVNSIKERIEPSSDPLDTALRIFIYGWSAIKRDETAAPLRGTLYAWA